MVKLRPEVKEHWLAALRGGEYAQGNYALRSATNPDTYAYCCLGVLCDLASKAGVGRWDGIDFVVGQCANSSVLTRPIAQWAFTEDSKHDIDHHDPKVFVPGKRYASLASLNDGGETFNTIANLIEEQL